MTTKNNLRNGLPLSFDQCVCDSSKFIIFDFFSSRPIKLGKCAMDSFVLFRNLIVSAFSANRENM